MTILGPEGLIDEVREYLKDNLPAVLHNVDGRYSKRMALVPMKEWRIDDPTQGVMPSQMPCGWVVSPFIRLDQWSQTYQYGTTDVLIWILIADPNAEVLRRRVYRTALAVWETLRNGALDSAITWSIIETPEMDFSEIISGPDSKLFQDARVRVQMTTRELQ